MAHDSTISPVPVQWEQNVNCELCGSGVHEVLRTDCAHTGYCFVRCTCGLMFYSPRYSEDYVIERYLRAGDAQKEAASMFDKGVFFGEPAGTKDTQKEMLRSYYRRVLEEQNGWRHGGNPKAIFDVGTSVGWLLHTAQDLFKGIEADGCDANEFSAEKARVGFGLNVRGCTFQRYSLEDHQHGMYDLVCMMDYIEHTYTPVKDLEKLRSIASSNGVLMLKTFLHELDPCGNYVHPVFHAYHFTEETLRRAIMQAGWRILNFDLVSERHVGQVIVHAAPV